MAAVATTVGGRVLLVSIAIGITRVAGAGRKTLRSSATDPGRLPGAAGRDPRRRAPAAVNTAREAQNAR